MTGSGRRTPGFRGLSGIRRRKVTATRGPRLSFDWLICLAFILVMYCGALFMTNQADEIPDGLFQAALVLVASQARLEGGEPKDED